MAALNLQDVVEFIEQNVETFHSDRIDSINGLKIKKILSRKNPYLFRVKATADVDDLLDSILSAHLSSSEESKLGNFLEKLAIFINGKTFGGHKSTTPGLDLEFDRDNVHWGVTIKSGPNWGNSDQIAKMKENFARAKRTFGTSGNKGQIEFVNGCCYGHEKNPHKGNYYKYCGQQFWTFISGSPTLYTDLIDALGHKAQAAQADFRISYDKVRKRLFEELKKIDLANEDGTINWKQLAEISSKSKS